MKKTYCFIVNVILVVGFMLFAFPAKAVITKIDHYTANVGNQLIVPVRVWECDTIGSVSLALQYNNTLLQYNGFQNIYTTVSSLIVNNSNLPGSNTSNIFMAYYGLNCPGIPDSGIVVELIFTCIDEGTSPLTWDTTIPGNCQYTGCSVSELPSVFFSGSVNIAPPPAITINGQLVYDNLQNSPISNTAINLSFNGSYIQSAITDSLGNFSFTLLTAAGTYSINADITKAPGGINSTDALLALKQYVLGNILQGLKLTAADVDGSGYVNAIDALKIAKHFVEPGITFPAGAWYVESYIIQASAGNTYTPAVKLICIGDLDGSFIPGL